MKKNQVIKSIAYIISAISAIASLVFTYFQWFIPFLTSAFIAICGLVIYLIYKDKINIELYNQAVKDIPWRYDKPTAKKILAHNGVRFIVLEKGTYDLYYLAGSMIGYNTIKKYLILEEQ